MKKIIGLLLLLPLFVQAQSTGIQFESGLSWKQVQAKAKAENKYIFVDCYATWCGPCKWMSANIFPDKQAGDYMNAHFINVGVQMDKTAKDEQFVKDWYADAKMMHDLYKIGSYPTYLFFSPDGTIIHRFSGSRGDVKTFLAAVRETFDPAKQYYGMVKQWTAHKTDTAYLLKAFYAVKGQHDQSLIDSIGQAYLNGQTDLLTQRNIWIISISNAIKSSKDKWFKLYLNNAALVDEKMKNETWAEETLSPVIFNETILSLFGKNAATIDWKKIAASIKTNYPTISDKLVQVSEGLFQNRIDKFLDANIAKDTSITMTENDWVKISEGLNKKFKDYDYNQLLLQDKADYYNSKKLWPVCINTTYALIKQYGDKLGNQDLNNRCWDVIFMHSADPEILSEAAKQVKGSIDRHPNSDFSMSIDTYANLLYKLGKRDDALTWENNAIAVSVKSNGVGRDQDDFRANLAKMQQGHPTWEN